MTIALVIILVKAMRKPSTEKMISYNWDMRLIIGLISLKIPRGIIAKNRAASFISSMFRMLWALVFLIVVVLLVRGSGV
jgi:hypothetical protein